MIEQYYIDFKAVVQYFLIYLVILWNGSSVFLILRTTSKTLFQIIGLLMIFFALVITALREKEDIRFYFLQIGVLLLLATIVVRFASHGGIGLLAYVILVSPIEIVFLAYYVDEKLFPKRLLNMVSFLVVVSLIFWAVQLVAPQIIKTIFHDYSNGTIWTDWSQDPPIVHEMKNWGKYLFTLVEREPKRNCGLFSEPGNYQIVLNSVLFLVLFLPQYFGLEAKQQMRYALLYIFAVVTTQSTSAYLCLILIVGAYIITYQERKKLMDVKRRVITFGVVAVAVLLAEYLLNGEDSFVFTAIINKLFSNETEIGVNSSGLARILKINACVELIKQNPWGAGADAVLDVIKTIPGGAAGAGIFEYATQMGIPCLIYTLYWQLKDILTSFRLSIWAKLSFLYLFGNVMLAQTAMFWPLFIVISMAVKVMKQQEGEDRKWIKNEVY